MRGGEGKEHIALVRGEWEEHIALVRGWVEERGITLVRDGEGRKAIPYQAMGIWEYGSVACVLFHLQWALDVAVSSTVNHVLCRRGVGVQWVPTEQAV